MARSTAVTVLVDDAPSSGTASAGAGSGTGGGAATGAVEALERGLLGRGEGLLIVQCVSLVETALYPLKLFFKVAHRLVIEALNRF